MRTDLDTTPDQSQGTSRGSSRGTHLRTDLLWRAVVPLAALATLGVDLPRLVGGALALLGLALAGERMVGLRTLGTADRVLVGVGGGLVVLVLAGMLLGSTPLGLSRTSWVVTLAVLALLGLLLAALLAPRTTATGDPAIARSERLTALRLLPWLAVAGTVVVVAVQMSATSLSASERPPVQMSFGKVSGTDVQVVVSSSDRVGPLEVRTAAGGDEVSYPLFSLGDDGSQTTTLTLPTTGRFVISVSYPDQTQPLRTLVLDR